MTTNHFVVSLTKVGCAHTIKELPLFVVKVLVFFFSLATTVIILCKSFGLWCFRAVAATNTYTQTPTHTQTILKPIDAYVPAGITNYLFDHLFMDVLAFFVAWSLRQGVLIKRAYKRSLYFLCALGKVYVLFIVCVFEFVWVQYNSKLFAWVFKLSFKCSEWFPQFFVQQQFSIKFVKTSKWETLRVALYF